MNRIYLDYNASTPIDPVVAARIRELLEDHYGNPSSTHWAGAAARSAVERGREEVAALLGCSPAEIVFTSGGSESNNHALKGAFFSLRERGNHIITTAIEHPAIIQPCRFLERLGAEVTYIGVDRCGRVDPDDIRKAVTGKTILISVMHANNETGTIQPIREISLIARESGVLFHTDAAQSVGKIPTRVEDLGVDLLSVAGHKLYAPKGIGALYIRKGITIEPLVHGAGHESGRRAGTENVLLDAALGAACRIAADSIGMAEVKNLRDRFWTILEESFGEGVVLNGHPDERLPNTLNVSFPGRAGGEILAKLDSVAASTGSACHSGEVKLSPVLEAMGVSPHIGMGAIRFSLGKPTTLEEIETVAGLLRRAVAGA